jgi:hypothetical protein
VTTHNHPSESLNAAVSAAGIPSANHDFIRMVTDAVGIDRYRYVDQADKPYVIATRRDGLRDLHIYYVATNGLYSEVEVIRIAGDGADRRPSGSRNGTWCVEHPVNQSLPPGPGHAAEGGRKRSRRPGSRAAGTHIYKGVGNP